MSSNPEKRSKASRMYPALHGAIAAAVSNHIPTLHFHPSQTDKTPNNQYTTFVVGHFICYNPRCSAHSWTSGQIATLIRGYAGSEYNAEVLGQRCRSCNRLGKLVLDKQSYIDRVSYRLLVWAGVQMVRPAYGARETPPHETEFCEGCKRGICRSAGY